MLQTKAASHREGRTVSHTAINCTHGTICCVTQRYARKGAHCPLETRLTCLSSLWSSSAHRRPLLVSAKGCYWSWAKEGQVPFTHRAGSVPSTAPGFVRSSSLVHSPFRGMSLIKAQKAGQITWEPTERTIRWQLLRVGVRFRDPSLPCPPTRGEDTYLA